MKTITKSFITDGNTPIENLQDLICKSNDDNQQQTYLILESNTLNWGRLRLINCLKSIQSDDIDIILILPWRDHVDGYYHNLKAILGSTQWEFKPVTLFTWKYPIFVRSKRALMSLYGYLQESKDPSEFMRIVMV